MGKGGKSFLIVMLTVLAGMTVIGYFLVRMVLERNRVADRTVTTIRGELDGLDAPTRAAVIAKLSAGEVRRRRGGSTA